MKKLFVVLLVLCMLFMTACGTPTPSEALKADMENAKSSPEEILGDVGDDGFSEESNKLLIEKILEFDYKLGEEVINEEKGTATVETTITTYPFGDMFTSIMSKLISEAFANPNMTDAQLEARMDALLADGLKGLEKTYTKTIKIELALEDGQWVVQESDAMSDALTGGMLSWANSVNNAG